MNQVCYAAIVLILAFIMLFRVRLRSKDTELCLDKNTTNVLKGYAIMVIIIHHLVLRMSRPGILLPFRIGGYLGVTIFFFLSGYGLVCASEKREKNYSKGFMKKRIEKVYVPAVFAQLVYMIILLLCFDYDYSPAGFIKGTFSLYPIDTSQWYIIALFIWYFTFWLLLKLDISWNKRIIALFVTAAIYIAMCSILGLTKNWYDTALCFPLGVTFAVYREKLVCFFQKNILIIPLALIVFGVTVLFSFGKENSTALILRMISTISFIAIIIIFIRLFDVSSNKLAAYIGTISLECYLVHGKVIRIVKLNFGSINAVQSIIYFIFTVIATIAFVFILKRYNSLLGLNSKHKA